MSEIFSSEIYCISYSDFGYLLTENDWSVSIRKLDDYNFDVYEDLLKTGEIILKRRFLGSVPSVFEDSSEFKSEPELPSDIERFLMTYKGVNAVVVGSYDFDRLFNGLPKDSLGFVLTDKAQITCEQYSSEDLAEDMVLLASNGTDLNCTDSL